MQTVERAKAEMKASGSLILPGGYREGLVLPHFTAEVMCYDKYGNVKWDDVIENLVTTQGKNHIIDTYFNGSSYTGAWYVGLIDNAGSPTVLAADTYASHTYAELTAYSQATRPALTLGAASAGAGRRRTCSRRRARSSSRSSSGSRSAKRDCPGIRRSYRRHAPRGTNSGWAGICSYPSSRVMRPSGGPVSRRELPGWP